MSINANARPFTQPTGNAFLDAFHAGKDRIAAQEQTDAQANQNDLDNQFREMQAQWQQEREQQHQDYLNNIAAENARSNKVSEANTATQLGIQQKNADTTAGYRKDQADNVQETQRANAIAKALQLWNQGVPINTAGTMLNPEDQQAIVKTLQPLADQMNQSVAPQQAQEASNMDTQGLQGATQGSIASGGNPVAIAMGAGLGAMKGAGANPIGLSQVTPESVPSPAFQQAQLKQQQANAIAQQKADAVKKRVSDQAQKITNDKDYQDAMTDWRNKGLDSQDTYRQTLGKAAMGRVKNGADTNTIRQNAQSVNGSMGLPSKGIINMYGTIYRKSNEEISQIKQDMAAALSYMQSHPSRPDAPKEAKVWDDYENDINSGQARINLYIKNPAFQQANEFMGKYSAGLQDAANLRNINKSGKPSTAIPNSDAAKQSSGSLSSLLGKYGK